MATRSAIGVMHGDVCKAVYCHWDGYIEHNGKILLENYDSTKANFLVALGDISSLRAEIGEQHPFSKFECKDGEYDEAKYENWTTFYGRDRGEENTSWKTFHTFKDFLSYYDGSGCEYYYLMKDGVWYVSQYGRPLEVLADVINSFGDE
jgi:hypothetical protein